MIDYKKKYVRNIRLNSFRPLCSTEIGLKAIGTNQFPPFIDASCRREPDFESDYPSITSLCRQEMFAPHLYPNDIIVYITVKGKWLTGYDHHRLIAILEVIDHKNSHAEGASWYRSRNVRIPSNCMIPDNPPHPFAETAGNYETTKGIRTYLNYSSEKQQLVGAKKVELWNDQYQRKSWKMPDFIITKPIFRELRQPPILTEEAMTDIFGKVPNTRNPNIIQLQEFKALAQIANINFIH